MKIKSLKRILSTVIILSSITGFATYTSAETAKEQKQQESTASTNNGLPFHRRDGGTRSGCIADNRGFVALIPQTAVNSTASLNPKLYFHVPKTNHSQTIEFVLRDKNDRLIHESFIETEGKGGIMSVNIPLSTQQKSLNSAANYRWYLSYICNKQKRSQDLVLQGWIKHQELSQDTQKQIESFSLEEQANYYREQGLWYDALAVAAIQYKQQSSSQKWSEFLTSIGLEELIDEPLIE